MLYSFFDTKLNGIQLTSEWLISSTRGPSIKAKQVYPFNVIFKQKNPKYFKLKIKGLLICTLYIIKLCKI